MATDLSRSDSNLIISSNGSPYKTYGVDDLVSSEVVNGRLKLQFADGQFYDLDTANLSVSGAAFSGTAAQLRDKLAGEVFSNEYPYGTHTFVAEDRARTANVSWAYSGTVRNVGPGQTYTTISAAIAAAASGDIIQLADGTYNTASESGGYLLINSATKRLLIRGNAQDNTKVVLQQSAAASFCVRLRVAHQVTFQNLTIEANQSNSTVNIDKASAEGGSTCVFDNCIIKQSGSAAAHAVYITDAGNNNSYCEFKDCQLWGNANAASYPLHVKPLIDSFATNYPSPVLVTGSTLYGQMVLGDSAVEFRMYDSALVQPYSSTPYCFALGQDTAAPTASLSTLDIRGCSFRYENGYYGHAVLLGRGTKNVYFVNNYIYMDGVANSLALGIVVKSAPTTLGGVVIDGNYIEAPRPLYIKGGQKNYLRYNTAISNYPDTTGGYGLELNNPNDSGAPASTGNVVTHNTLTGKRGALGFSTTSGAADAAASAAACIFNRNVYKGVTKANYINSDGVLTDWNQRGTYWTQDTNSIYMS